MKRLESVALYGFGECRFIGRQLGAANRTEMKLVVRKAAETKLTEWTSMENISEHPPRCCSVGSIQFGGDDSSDGRGSSSNGHTSSSLSQMFNRGRWVGNQWRPWGCRNKRAEIEWLGACLSVSTESHAAGSDRKAGTIGGKKGRLGSLGGMAETAAAEAAAGVTARKSLMRPTRPVLLVGDSNMRKLLMRMRDVLQRAERGQAKRRTEQAKVQAKWVYVYADSNGSGAAASELSRYGAIALSKYAGAADLPFAGDACCADYWLVKTLEATSSSSSSSRSSISIAMKMVSAEDIGGLYSSLPIACIAGASLIDSQSRSRSGRHPIPSPAIIFAFSLHNLWEYSPTSLPRFVSQSGSDVMWLLEVLDTLNTAPKTHAQVQDPPVRSFAPHPRLVVQSMGEIHWTAVAPQ
jgi:hypothetical protein